MHDFNAIQIQELKEKWKPVLEHPDQAEIKDPYRKAVTAVLLENTERATREENALGTQTMASLNETNVAPTAPDSGNLTYSDPVIISMIRRTMPNLMAYDLVGVQPMTGPTGLIFAMKSRYTNQTGTEALFDEADTTFSGTGTHAGTDPFAGSSLGVNAGGEAFVESANGSQTGAAGSTAAGEGLGKGVDQGMGTNGHFNEMAFSIDRVSVTAKTRALKAEYTTELSQDLRAVHGLDAESELSTILSTEITAEINREVLRNLYDQAKLGCAAQTTNKGIFDLTTDADGRWSVENFKALMFQIEKEANVIAKETRRGKGNVIVCSSDVASALAMSGLLDYNPQMDTALNVDDTGQTFAGVLNKKFKVYIDPYFSSAGAYDFAMVGYRGSSPFDAGYFYCPYVPMQMVRAVGENTFQPKIGFKTRYGMVKNPFAGAARTPAADGAFPTDGNQYYRLFRVDNINSAA
jgi:hypothetical protein